MAELTNGMIAQRLGWRFWYGGVSDGEGNLVYWTDADGEPMPQLPDWLHDLNAASRDLWSKLLEPDAWGLSVERTSPIMWSFASMGLGVFYTDACPARAICQAWWYDMDERDGLAREEAEEAEDA